MIAAGISYYSLSAEQVVDHIIDCDDCGIEQQDYEGPMVWACDVLKALGEAAGGLSMADVDRAIQANYAPAIKAQFEASRAWGEILLSRATNRDDTIELRIDATMKKRYPEEDHD